LTCDDDDDFDDGSRRMYVYTNGYVYTMSRMFDDYVFRICCIMLCFTDHYCLVFQSLGLSLYDLVKMNNYEGR
jgi:hypothetical protein